MSNARQHRHLISGSRGRASAWAMAGLLAALAIAISAPAFAAGQSSPSGFSPAPLASEPPVVIAVFPNHGPVHGKTRVKIKGHNLTGATEVHFGSTNAPGFTVKSDSEISLLDPAGVGVVDVTVTTPAGTSEIVPEDQFTYTGEPPGISGLSPNKSPASGGVTVAVKGVNFLGTSEVVFGSVSASSFTVNSEKSITAVAPAETVATVEVKVTTPYGTSPREFCAKQKLCSVRDLFKFVEPTITEVNPNHGPKAGGTSVTITGTGFAVGTTETQFKFGATPTTSVECTSITTCTAVSGAQKAGSVPVLVTVGGMKNKTTTAPRFTYE